MKLKYELTIVDIDGSPVAVPQDASEDCRCVLHMNGTAADILKVLENDVSEADIIAALLEQYEASEEQITHSVQKVLGILRENDLLVE